MDADASVTHAGDAGVRNQGHFAFQGWGTEGGGGDQHFGHATGDRAKPSEDDDMTGLDLTGSGGGRDGAGVVKTDGGAGEAGFIQAGAFKDDAMGGHIAEADLDVGIRFERMAERGQQRGLGRIGADGDRGGLAIVCE